MSQFIRQWRKDIRDLGTPEFDAAAALRDMMARRADIQRLASEDQRMALDLQDESRKKESHPLELEGKRQANTSLVLANKRFPRDAQIRDADEGRRAEVERRNQTAEAAAAAKAQLQADVTTGKLDPAEAADMATRMAESQLGMERGVSVVNDPVEVNRRAGASLKGLEVPFDEKSEGKRLENERLTKGNLLKAQQRRTELAQKRLNDTIKAASKLNQQQIDYTNQKLKQYDTEFEAHTSEIARLRSSIEFGTNLSETEIERDRAALIARGASPAGIRKIPGQKGYVVDDTALAGTIRGFKSIAPGAPGDKAMTAEMKNYEAAHQDLVKHRAILDLMLGQDISGAYGIPADEPSAPATVKPPEPARQPAPTDRKLNRKGKADARVAGQVVARSGPSGFSAEELGAKPYETVTPRDNSGVPRGDTKKTYDDLLSIGAREVRPGVLGYTSNGRRYEFDSSTGKNTVIK